MITTKRKEIMEKLEKSEFKKKVEKKLTQTNASTFQCNSYKFEHQWRLKFLNYAIIR